jgi:hypothetical protein
MQEEFGDSNPNQYKLTCSAGVAFVVQALANLEKPGATRQDLYNAMLRQKQLKLTDGPVPMKDREAQYDLQYKVVRSGLVEVLD